MVSRANIMVTMATYTPHIPRYTGWKGMIDAELLNEPMVKRTLSTLSHVTSHDIEPLDLQATLIVLWTS